MRKQLLYTFILLTIFASCKENDDTKPITFDNILNDKAHVVDTSAVLNCTISSLTLDKSKISFNPSVGDIILASPTLSNPKGVLSKILTISQNGNTINCSTQSSNLNEAFRQLYIDFKYVKDYSQNAHLRGIASIPFPTNYQLTPGLTVNGALQLNVPDVQIKYSKRDGALLPDTVLIVANVNTNGSILTMQANGALSVPEKTLYTFNNLPIIEVPVLVGGVPLIIPFWQYIEINTLPLNISGKMKFSIYPEFSASLGVSYTSGNWTNLSGFDIGATAETPIKTDFDSNLTASITFFNPTYKIGPFWDPTLYVFFKVPNELYGKIQTATPNYSLKYKLGFEAGVHYDFWLGISGQKSFSVPVYSTTIKEGDFENTFTDQRDGNVYKYITIGTQTWMIENLRYEPALNPGSNAIYTTCYEDDPSNCTKFGTLYSWGGNWQDSTQLLSLAPTGWHIPSNSEWDTLITYLGGSSIAGGKMKDVASNLWNIPNLAGTNSSGFTALPSGWVSDNFHSTGIGQITSWWTSTPLYPNLPAGVGTELVTKTLVYNNAGVATDTLFRTYIPIRCIKD